MRHGRRSVRGWAGFDINKHRKCEWLGSMLSSGRSSVDIGDAVLKSIRTRASAAPSMTRTFSGSLTDAKKGALLWVGKISDSPASTERWLASSYDGSSAAAGKFYLNNSHQLQFDLGGTGSVGSFTTSRVFRDYAKFWFIYVEWDTTLATAGDRIKLYINGTRETAFSAQSNPSINFAGSQWFSNSSAKLFDSFAGSQNFGGYTARFAFVDGSCPGFATFGRFSADTGAWVWRNPSGVTWGNKGFFQAYLIGAVASDLGTDTSGNGLTWTVNNISVTAGVTNDWLDDTPTNTFATLNPLQFSSGAPVDGALSSGGATYVTCTTIAPSTGKWKAEATVTSGTSANIGVIQSNPYLTATRYLGLSDTTNKNCSYRSLGNGKIVDGVATGGVGASYTTNDVVTVELDMDASPPTVSFYKGTGSLEFMQTLSAGFVYQFASSTDGGACTIVWNFGQRAFTRTPSTGFAALCTANLPTPAIGATLAARANKHFDVVSRAGTSANASVSSYGFTPDWLWAFDRAGAQHQWHDVVRGMTVKNQEIGSSNTSTEGSVTSCQIVQSAGGYAFSDGSSSWSPNTSGQSYIDWAWKVGGAPSATNSAGAGNTPTAGSVKINDANLGSALAGSIPVTKLSANTLTGISIATYTSTGANGTLAHGLAQAPELVIAHARTTSQNWAVWHSLFISTEYAFLNSTAGKTTAGGAALWNSAVPTSTVVSVGTDTNTNWSTPNDYVMYCFHSVDGYSKVGYYVGNGSTDGAFVWCGFRPRWIMIKRADGTGGWYIYDTVRNTYNAVDKEILANSNAAEATSADIDILSNGFKLRVTNTALNASSGQYIFLAIAETPFKYSTAR